MLTYWPLGDLNFKNVIFNLALLICIFKSSYVNVLRWTPQNLTDDKSTLVQVMAWCHQATSHYLNQFWSRFSTPYGVTRPQCVNIKIHIVYSIHVEGYRLWNYHNCMVLLKKIFRTFRPLGDVAVFSNTCMYNFQTFVASVAVSPKLPLAKCQWASFMKST